MWSPAANNAAAFAGFACAAGGEGLRRVVLISRPNGGKAATAALRIVVAGLPILAVVGVGLLESEFATGCFGFGYGDDTKVATWLWLALCLLCVTTISMLFRLFRRLSWLQPRTGCV